VAAADQWLSATGALIVPESRDDYEDVLAAARAALQPEAYAAVWAAGQRMSLDEAATYALACAGRPPP